jgi:hypothetical protein
MRAHNEELSQEFASASGKRDLMYWNEANITNLYGKLKKAAVIILPANSQVESLIFRQDISTKVGDSLAPVNIKKRIDLKGIIGVAP